MGDMSSGLQSTMDLHINKGKFSPIYLDLSNFDHVRMIGSALVKFCPNVAFHLAAISGVTPSVILKILFWQKNFFGKITLPKLITYWIFYGSAAF
jgi:hypothetical protein